LKNLILLVITREKGSKQRALVKREIGSISFFEGDIPLVCFLASHPKGDVEKTSPLEYPRPGSVGSASLSLGNVSLCNTAFLAVYSLPKITIILPNQILLSVC
jgi:hypothetical protein